MPSSTNSRDSSFPASVTEILRVLYLVVGQVSMGLPPEFGESRLYAGDYDRRFRPVGTAPRFPEDV